MKTKLIKGHEEKKFPNCRDPMPGVRNKEEELDLLIYEHKFDPVSVTETWWAGSRCWNVKTNGDSLCGKEQVGKRGGGATSKTALAVAESLISWKKTEMLMDRIQDGALVGICYRSPELHERMASRGPYAFP